MSADEALAIAGAMMDIAKSDGVHEAELELIRSLTREIHEDLGEDPSTALPEMTPERLAETLANPQLREVAISCAVILMMADGKVSDVERARTQAYARALGFSDEAYTAIETPLLAWVRGGDMEPVLDSIYA